MFKLCNDSIVLSEQLTATDNNNYYEQQYSNNSAQVASEWKRTWTTFLSSFIVLIKWLHKPGGYCKIEQCRLFFKHG